ncbi:hypothetical protein [Streptomyces sp. NPDC002533]
MSTITTQTETSFFPEPVATERARRGVEELMADFRTGAWRPSALESRVAQLLLVAAAGDGMLTSRRVRDAMWEGNLAMTHENGARFAQVLADLVPLLDDPYLTAIDIVDAAGEVVGAVASTATA